MYSLTEVWYVMPYYIPEAIFSVYIINTEQNEPEVGSEKLSMRLWEKIIYHSDNGIQMIPA